MLEVKLICIGKLKEKYWRDAVQEYAKRLSAFCRFQIIELNRSAPAAGSECGGDCKGARRGIEGDFGGGGAQRALHAVH